MNDETQETNVLSLNPNQEVAETSEHPETELAQPSEGCQEAETKESCPTEAAPEAPQQNLHTVKGFACLRVESLAQAASMLNLISKNERGHHRHVEVLQMMPEFNSKTQKTDFQILIKAPVK